MDDGAIDEELRRISGVADDALPANTRLSAGEPYSEQWQCVRRGISCHRDYIPLPGRHHDGGRARPATYTAKQQRRGSRR
jgi:hypothetical protein